MKTIQLVFLRLRNFKGIKELYVDFNGNETKIYGNNKAGKTSVYDSFLWLLFDKNSNNKTNFALKPLDENGDEIHHLETSVEGAFLVDGKELLLQKVFKEKWTAKRGVAQKELTGHDTIYMVDGVPMKKKEYVERISQLVDENIFKLISNTTHFNEQLNWKDMRKILMEIGGEVSNEEIFVAQDTLKGLSDLLEGRTIDELKKMVDHKMKSYNDELKAIPIRIEEIKSMMPESIDVTAELATIERLRGEIKELENQRYAIRNGEAIQVKRAMLNELTSEAKRIESDLNNGVNNDVERQTVKVQEAESNVTILENRLGATKEITNAKVQEAQNISKVIQEQEKQLVSMRTKFANLKAMTLESCDKCGQSLSDPEKQKEMDVKRNEEMAQINIHGKELASAKGFSMKRLDVLQNDCTILAEQVENLENELRESKEKCLKEQEKLNALKLKSNSLETNDSYKAICESIERVNGEIAQLMDSASGILEDLENDINSANDSIATAQMKVATQANVEQYENRVKELEIRQNELVKNYEKAEQTSYLIGEFLKTKVQLLESRINSKFKLVKFKMFKVQVNGEVVETCETLVDGVPYLDGLNNASKVNAGLDIVQTLSSHYQVKAPVFIDNAESVTEFLEVDNQVIKLIVSDKYQTLHIDTKGDN